MKSISVFLDIAEINGCVTPLFGTPAPPSVSSPEKAHPE